MKSRCSGPWHSTKSRLQINLRSLKGLQQSSHFFPGVTRRQWTPKPYATETLNREPQARNPRDPEAQEPQAFRNPNSEALQAFPGQLVLPLSQLCGAGVWILGFTSGLSTDSSVCQQPHRHFSMSSSTARLYNVPTTVPLEFKSWLHGCVLRKQHLDAYPTGFVEIPEVTLHSTSPVPCKTLRGCRLIIWNYNPPPNPKHPTPYTALQPEHPGARHSEAKRSEECLWPHRNDDLVGSTSASRPQPASEQRACG